MNKFIVGVIALLIIFDAAVLINFIRKGQQPPEDQVLSGWHSYENGKLLGKDSRPFTGIYKYFRDNGEVQTELTYKDGIVHGPWRGFFENGSLAYEYTAKNGTRYYEGKAYYKNGRVQSVIEQKNGIAIVKQYDVLGNVVSEGPLSAQ